MIHRFCRIASSTRLAHHGLLHQVRNHPSSTLLLDIRHYPFFAFSVVIDLCIGCPEAIFLQNPCQDAAGTLFRSSGVD